MVAAAVELVFVASDAIVKSHFTGQATLSQQLERPVDGGKSDLGIFFTSQTEELIGGKMVTGFEECAQNGVALVSVLQTHTFQVLVEDLLGFAHGFAIGRRMIVNSELQHWNWN